MALDIQRPIGRKESFFSFFLSFSSEYISTEQQVGRRRLYYIQEYKREHPLESFHPSPVSPSLSPFWPLFSSFNIQRAFLTQKKKAVLRCREGRATICSFGPDSPPDLPSDCRGGANRNRKEGGLEKVNPQGIARPCS